MYVLHIRSGLSGFSQYKVQNETNLITTEESTEDEAFHAERFIVVDRGRISIF